MCKNIKVISEVKKGQLFVNETCNLYYLNYNNLLFELTPQEFDALRNYVCNIEMDYWEHKYSGSNLSRKIPIPSTQQNLYLMFNRKEIEDLKSLLMDPNYDESRLLKTHEIEYRAYAN